MRKLLLITFIILLGYFIFYKSPIAASYNYNKAKSLYDNSQYEKSLLYFENALHANNNNPLYRFYYVLALSKAKPTYTVQKKLYEMASSTIIDEASKHAKIQSHVLKRKLLKDISNNYIYNTPMGNDIVRWDIHSFPLKVYIEKTSDIPQYYYTSIDLALKEWGRYTNFVKFTNVNSDTNANIIIKFKDIPDNLCSNGYCKYTAGYTEPDIDRNKILKKMDLTLYKTKPNKENFSKDEIFNTILHEIGHTLGIMGHSDNPRDIMYSMKDNLVQIGQYHLLGANTLSMSDVVTLSLLYRIKPTISNTKNLESEQFYYAPLIIGTDDERLNRKLTENLDYVKKYPNFASGYINLASVYSDLGDFDSALKELAQGETYANNEDEKFLIYFNRAIIYYNKQDYNNALTCANTAKGIKNTENIQELIQDIENLLK